MTAQSNINQLQKTQCPFFTGCSKGYQCPVALTEKIKQRIEKFSLRVNIYDEPPMCYDQKNASRDCL